MPLTLGDLTREWVTGLCRPLLGAAAPHDDLVVESFALAPLDPAQGVLSRYPRARGVGAAAGSAEDRAPAADEQRWGAALLGHHLLTIHAVLAGAPRRLRLVLKSKAPGAVVRRRVEAAYRARDARLADAQRRVSPSILDDSHTRELHIYSLEQPCLRAITPAIAGVWLDPEAQIFAVAMELLEGVRHEQTLHDLDAWLPGDLELVLTGIARVHGELLGLDPVTPPHWLVPFAQLHNPALLAYQAELLRYNADAFPELFGAERVRQLEALLASASQRHRAILARPLTLIHGDFSPRNLCLKPDSRGALRLCAYDWELAQVHLPARDVCELLCYTLPPAAGWRGEPARRLLERYREALAAAAGRELSRAGFEHELALALQELCTFKLLVQGITHQLLGNRRYFERLVRNAFDGLAAFAARIN